MMRIGALKIFRVAAVVMAGMACGQSAQSDAPQLDDDLAAKIAFGLRWIGYWEPDYIINYKAGKTIVIRLVQSPDELAVFLSEVRLSMAFRRSSEGKLNRLDFVGGLSRIGNETLDSDVRFYIQRHSKADRPGFRLVDKPGADRSTAGSTIPAERVTIANPLTPAAFRVSDASFRLPDLAPPKHISERIKPPAAMVDSLRSAVIRAALSHMAAKGKPAAVVIPYFSPEDPAISVFVTFHETDFSEGIFGVRPDAGDKWSIGNLMLNRGPGRLDAIIARIRATKLVEFVVNPAQ